MTSEQELGEVVRAWADLQRPGDRVAAECAAAIAQATYHDGFPVGEACERARAFLAIRAQHAAREMLSRRAPARIAS